MQLNEVDDYSFSLMHGGSMYKYLGDTIENATKGLGEDKKVSPIICDSMTGEPFFIKRLRYFDDDLNGKDITIHRHYIKTIKNPPDSLFFIWPLDIIEFNADILSYYDGMKKNAGLKDNALYLVQHQDVFSNDLYNDPSCFGLLFDTERVEGLEGLYKYLSGLKMSKKLNYENPDVRHIIMQIINRFEELESVGYYYYDFDFYRFMIDSRLNVYVNFTNHLFHITEYEDLLSGKNYLEEPTELALDFAEPAFASLNNNIPYASGNTKHGDVKVPDKRTIQYGLTAMIFYLMFGQYAYEGSMYDTRSEIMDMHIRIQMCKDHIKSPVFIFDPANNYNIVEGITESERKLLELWNNCPKIIRDYFIYILSEAYAKREEEKELYSDWNWKKVLSDFKWQ